MQNRDPNMVQQQQSGKVTVSAAAFAAKYRSKRECYNFCAVEANIYLPAYEQVTIYFLKDIMRGQK